MKLYAVFERLFDRAHWEPQGLGAALGVCFDEEQAHEIVRARTLAFWRGDPPAAARRSLGFFLEHVGYGVDVVEHDDLFFLLLEQGDAYDRSLFFVVDVVALELAALPRARADRRDTLHRLSQLLAPWSPDAARALVEDA